MGSLFRLCEHWSTSFSGSECSPSAFTVGNVDNHKGDKIVIGTFSGKLQVWKPSSTESDANDLLYERQFDDPILQLCCAGFEEVTDGITENLLAILFPHKILFARLSRLTEEVNFLESEESEQKDVVEFYFYNFEVYFEAELAHSSFNMTVGKFGRAKHALLCVQALDGHLSFVDPRKVLFSGFLPSNQFLIPGHLAYVPEKDLLITHNSSLFLMCYSFPSIVTAFHKASANVASSISTSLSKMGEFGEGGIPSLGASLQNTSSPLLPTWTFNLGEDVVGIEVCATYKTSSAPRSFSSASNRNNEGWRTMVGWGKATPSHGSVEAIQTRTSDIVVLCLYHLYVFSSAGACMFAQKLDVEGISLKSYPVSRCEVDNILVGTAIGSIDVYSNYELVWSAKIPSTAALALGVGTMCGTEGMIVVLGEDQRITVSYLGTDPVETPLKLLESRVQQYGEMVDEIESLSSVVKEVDNQMKRIGINNKGRKNLQGSSPSSGSSSVTMPSKKKRNVEDGTVDSSEGSVSAGVGAEEDKERIKVQVSFSNVVREGQYNAVKTTIRIFLGPCTPVECTVSDVLVQFQAARPLQCTPSAFRLDVLEKGTPWEGVVDIAPYNDEAVMMIPSSLQLLVVVSGAVDPFPIPTSFTSSSRMGNVSPPNSNIFFSQRRYVLPFSLVATPTEVAAKSMACSLQLNTEKAVPPSLLELFRDFSSMGSFTENTLGVEYSNGEKAVVLVSKNAGRFKVKSTTMEGLWLLFSALLSHIQDYYHVQGETVETELPDLIPLLEYQSVIRKHQAIRKEVEVGEARLEQAAAFYRLAEKRLLSRLIETNPCNTNALELLLTESNFIIQQAMERIALAKSRLLQAAAMLNACSQLFCTCLEVKCKTTITPREVSVLRALFQCRISDDMNEIWEESVYEVLRSWRRRIEGSSEPAPLSLDQLEGVVTGTREDVESHDEYKLSRLEEHLQWLVDHLMKGKPLL